MNASRHDIEEMDAERRIHRALAHPAFSDWLKSALRSALECEPLRLANDLELLGHLLRPWSEARLAHHQDAAPGAGAHEPTRQMSRA